MVTLVLLLCVAVVGVPACASPHAEVDSLQVVTLETTNTLQLESRNDGIVHQLAIELGIEPKVPGEFVVIGHSREGRQDDALLQLTVRWRDFVGTSPTSFGGSRSRPVPFGDDGRMSRGEPLTREFVVPLDSAQPHVLARTVDATARLHPVDVLGEEVRSGGARLEFPVTRIETLARAPGGTLAEWFNADTTRDPDELFLRAAASAPEERGAVVGQLVKALSALKGPEREACFGALHFLTGETRGRSVYSWETWLRARQVEGGG